VLRRLSPVLVTLLAVTVVSAASAAAHVRSASAVSADTRMTITITSQMRNYTQHDLAPKGKENKGDWFRYRALLRTVGPLFGKKTKNLPVGWEAGTQTYINKVDARIKGTATFPGQGTIKFRGVMRTLKNGMIRVPVVGGTGKFKGATGVLLIGAGNLTSVNTYRLKIPESGAI
jgi:hypothetical protein